MRFFELEQTRQLLATKPPPFEIIQFQQWLRMDSRHLLVRQRLMHPHHEMKDLQEVLACHHLILPTQPHQLFTP